MRILIEAVGHEAIVANARELQAVTGRVHRSDAHDARQLARLARVDAQILNPVDLRNTAQQADMFILRARTALAGTRLLCEAVGRARSSRSKAVD